MTALTATKPQQLIPAGASQIQIELTNMPSRQLSNVLLGRTFVFGLVEDNSSWCLVRTSFVRSISFLTSQSLSSSKVSWSRKTAGELLASLDLPASAYLQFREKPETTQQLVVEGVSRGFIATDSYRHPHIPLAAMSYLEIEGVQYQKTQKGLN
jgi:hypothetical protein